jgi:ubiquinone/menaquinone biosynthesis C-methylase UbiE
MMNLNTSAKQFYTETYDTWMTDWPGEVDFYRELVSEEMQDKPGIILDVACGTGRIGLRLAEDENFVVGLDRSPDMLAIARHKSAGNDRISWVEGDMRSFELDKRFDLAMIPSHSFQNLNFADDQAACLACIWKHLKPGGLLVVHLDHMNAGNMRWLGEISGGKGGVFEEEGQFKHPRTGVLISTSAAWSYEPASQTAIQQTIWEEIDPDEKPARRWKSDAIRLHCVFRFEMEHLLRRCGYEVEHVHGDFHRQELRDDSPHMVWLARRPKKHQ